MVRKTGQSIPDTAVILAGGLGTRLRPLTCRLPKSLVPIANRPLLVYALELLQQHGVQRVVLLLMYRAEAVREAVEQACPQGLRVELVASTEDYGTAGSVRQALPLLGEEFFVMAGDLLTDIDLRRMYSFHREAEAIATIAVTRVANPTAYGLVLSAPDGRVETFLEKPSWGQVVTDTVNAGVYVLHRGVLEAYPEGKALSFEHDVFPDLLRRKAPVLAYEHSGYWRDLGSLDDYREANVDVLEGRFPSAPTPWSPDLKENWVDPGATIVGPTLLGGGCRIGRGAWLEKCVVGSRCEIAEGARLVRCVVWSDVRIGPGSWLENAVVASGSRLGCRVYVPAKVVLGERVLVGNNVRFHEGLKIWPGKEIEDGALVTTSLVGAERWGRELFEGSRITGVVNEELTPEFGARLGAAVGSTFAPGDYVVSSRDVSPAARMLSRALICGLMSAGVHVEDLRVTPIPIVRYALRTGREVGGFYVRKSPFDPQLVDILFFDRDGRDLSLGRVKAIERMFYREDFVRVPPDQVGQLEFPVRVTEAYIEDFLSHLDLDTLRASRLRVVIDYSHGAASFALPQILGALQCNAISLNAFADPTHLTRSREDFARALAQLATIVTSVGADVGLLLDAGAEKIFLVDEKGRYIDSDRLLVLVTYLVLQQMGVKRIAVPVTVSSQVEQLAQQHGVEVVRTPYDSRALIESCLAGGVQFAGDGLGGFIFSDFLFAFDAMYALARILELMARSQVRFGELDRLLPQRPLVRLEVPCPRTRKGELMRRLHQLTADLPRDLTDGIRLLVNGGWVLLLPDHSRPTFHIRAEADDPLRAAELARHYRDLVRQWLAT
ncbi:MAG: sugar phosphate nucleotidyltransferase [candidate division KSB1 bacterium]|nr:sugar phosphate nucleotidyltransferase [candidate division KSB1 bacterium]